MDSTMKQKEKRPINIPFRSEILDYLQNKQSSASRDDMYQKFAVGDNLRPVFQGRLDRMRKSGLIVEGKKGRLRLPDDLVLVRGTVSGHADGYGFVVPDGEGDGDLYLHRRQMERVLHGDRVLARVRRTDHRGRLEGAVIEVLNDTNKLIVGRFHLRKGLGLVQPDNPRYGRDISIPRRQFAEAKEGDVVMVEITGHPIEHGQAIGKIVEVIGQSSESGIENEIAIRKHEIPHQWPEEVNTEIKNLCLTADVPGPNRRDVRHIPLITIDGEDAKDFDDAVYCLSNKSGWKLMVAIADVSHYVKTGSALDAEAYNRGNSVYFPRRVIPMLPEELSNGVCSLNPGEDRNCMVCEMEIDESGKTKTFSFYQALMYSHGRLTYEEADRIVSGDKQSRSRRKPLLESLDALKGLADCLQKARKSQGSMDFSFPEPHVLFDDNNHIEHIHVRERNDAHRLIEECMLAANVCAAKFVLDKCEHGVYRNHFGPEPDALKDLQKFLSVLRLKLGGGDAPTANDYQKLMSGVVSDESLSFVVQTVLLRSLSRAVYSHESGGHFALSFPVYTHFTSPIRRYSDLIVHREIKQALNIPGSCTPLSLGLNYAMAGDQCTFTEQRADNAAWDVIAWLKTEFMEDKVGEEYDATISGVKDFGLFVQLKDMLIDGMVHVTRLGTEYFSYDRDRFRLVGEKSGNSYSLGDSIRVRVIHVDRSECKIDLELASLPPFRNRNERKLDRKAKIGKRWNKN